MSPIVGCQRPGGCRCEWQALRRMPCGTDTLALMVAAARVRDGEPWMKGAPSHLLAELLAELDRDGYVLAKRIG